MSLLGCQTSAEQWKAANAIPMHPGRVQRWLMVTRRAGKNPTALDVGDDLFAFFNAGAVQFGLARAKTENSVLAGVRPNVERLNVLTVSRTPFQVHAKALKTAEQLRPPLKLAENGNPEIWAEVQFLYTGTESQLPWPYWAGGIRDCVEDAEIAVAAVYPSLAVSDAPEPPPLRQMAEFPDLVPDTVHKVAGQIETASKVLLYGAVAIGLWYALKTAQDVRGRVAKI